MTVLAWRKPAPDPSSFDDELSDPQEDSDFYPGERVCAPPERMRSTSALSLCLALLLAAGGWYILGYDARWQDWFSSKLAAASAVMAYRAPQPAPAQAAAPAPTEPQPATQVAAAHQATKLAEPPPLKSIATAPADNIPVEKAPAGAPLPPVAVEYTDPYQKRAVAVGLHPDVSRALLSRLSPADYRNAAVAIDTAVAKTPDSGTFTWPRQRTPELALFQVRFVPGAAPDCRRYVVTVTKDRWSTTAPPMERCGTHLASRRK